MARRRRVGLIMTDLQHDFDVVGSGSVCLLTPLTDDAWSWAREFLPDDGPMLGSSYGVESRYIMPILEGISEAGMTISGSV